MSFNKDQKQLAAKIESVEGTVEALANADAIRITEVDFEPLTELVDVEYLDSDKSGSAALRGMESGRITAKLPIKGGGIVDTAPEWNTLLLGCSMEETIDAGVDIEYTPVSTGDDSLTLGQYYDGKLNRIWGARGNFKIILEVGKPGFFEFEFLGAGYDDADVAMLSPTYDAVVPPVCKGISFSIGSYSYTVSRIELDFGNPMTLRQSINAATGNVSTITGRRRGVGSMDPEITLVVTNDTVGLLKSGAEGALTATLGSANYNKITITAPKVEISNLRQGERGEIGVYEADLRLNRSVGNDELVINIA
jgi:hypothetical protein